MFLTTRTRNNEPSTTMMMIPKAFLLVLLAATNVSGFSAPVKKSATPATNIDKTLYGVDADPAFDPVSYTHLTLPTILHV